MKKVDKSRKIAGKSDRGKFSQVNTSTSRVIFSQHSILKANFIPVISSPSPQKKKRFSKFIFKVHRGKKRKKKSRKALFGLYSSSTACKSLDVPKGIESNYACIQKVERKANKNFRGRNTLFEGKTIEYVVQLMKVKENLFTSAARKSQRKYKKGKLK